MVIPGQPGEVKGFLGVEMCYMLCAMLRTLVLVLLLLTGGCAWMRPAPSPILPPEELYRLGEAELEKKRYPESREHFRKVVERHPNSSYAPRARFLMGEAFYRDAEFAKAAKEFEAFLAFYPRHEIADLVQYRYAMTYYDQIKPIEQDQGLAGKAMDQFKKLVKDYPESRYATDALAKVEVCRGRLAQKEVWVAAWYIGQGNPSGARPRLEKVIKDYPRAPVIPEALSLLADVNFSEGRNTDALALLRQLASEYGYTEWGKRAAQRLRAQR
jgi:outer membrane protein assembly factor BamD